MNNKKIEEEGPGCIQCSKYMTQKRKKHSWESRSFAFFPWSLIWDIWHETNKKMDSILESIAHIFSVQ